MPVPGYLTCRTTANLCTSPGRSEFSLSNGLSACSLRDSTGKYPMIRFALILTCCIAVGTTCASSTLAGNFRISTTIYDLSATAETGKPQAIATSLSLFHHRKVYDYISTAGEVMIFEPATNKFTILSTSRSLATTVDFDEIKHLIKVGKTVVANVFPLAASCHSLLMRIFV